ncbi:hypothetical protein Theco_3983 (plasmid) [Thermobacillus composti KWC4]|jgi:hypothetical protein|uniref:Uncharacterized protein n=1 Tax=Thermobacillus composti (strain DSM 18247 / JCM 13945 / KWC4) TaxID=717605 RepID=L0EKD6_THECK|nr:hypothetical protein [Thermobacillus composti]AGA59987.1 hypothetical protein Theco_3983 [Thermobacillus composti KWC4]
MSSEWRRLTAPEFLDPRVFNALRHGDKHESIAEDAKTVILQGVRFTVPSPIFVPGEIVYVRLRRFFEFMRKEDWDCAEALRAKEAADRAIREKAEYERRREENRKFNLSFGFPARFTIGQKSVRSGLLENSWGDGRNKRSVYHVVLEETISIGKLYRKSGDFLCTRDPGWLKHVDRLEDGRVNCKACLQILNRYGSKR